MSRFYRRNFSVAFSFLDRYLAAHPFFPHIVQKSMVPFSARAVRTAAVLAFFFGTTVFAAEPLFPAPIHLSREVHDPISGKTVVVQEYGYGNRLVSVRGPKTSIADFEKSELIEIDRDAGTYSVTRFETIAKAGRSLPSASARAASARPALRPVGSKVTAAGKAAEVFESSIEGDDGNRSVVQITVDRSVGLSRAALEVLTGAAYPATRTPEHDMLFAASAPGRTRMTTDAAGSRADREYALPVEQLVRHHVDGQTIEYRTVVTRVGSEMPPADVISIPPGARLVDSRAVAIARELDRIDNPSTVP
jgi:hypothetical protein